MKRRWSWPVTVTVRIGPEVPPTSSTNDEGDSESADPGSKWPTHEIWRWTVVLLLLVAGTVSIFVISGGGMMTPAADQRPGTLTFSITEGDAGDYVLESTYSPNLGSQVTVRPVPQAAVAALDSIVIQSTDETLDWVCSPLVSFHQEWADGRWRAGIQSSLAGSIRVSAIPKISQNEAHERRATILSDRGPVRISLLTASMLPRPTARTFGLEGIDEDRAERSTFNPLAGVTCTQPANDVSAPAGSGITRDRRKYTPLPSPEDTTALTHEVTIPATELRIGGVAAARSVEITLPPYWNRVAGSVRGLESTASGLRLPTPPTREAEGRGWVLTFEDSLALRGDNQGKGTVQTLVSILVGVLISIVLAFPLSSSGHRSRHPLRAPHETRRMTPA